MPPLVSCIVPAFNYGRFLAAALDSILAQTYRPIEIIVVDGASTDNTREVAAQYGDQVRYIFQQVAGAPATRNVGIREARGEFVAFLDADDLWRPEKLALQMARFAARPELDFCLGHAQIFWDVGLEAEAERFKNHRRAQPQPAYATTTMLARRALFDTVGLLKTDLITSDATEWILRALEGGAVIEVLPEILVLHRFHGANLSQTNVAERRREWLRFVKAHLDKKRGANA